jgi:Fis family transcriptional regulator, factor for inversion stimulation protein
MRQSFDGLVEHLMGHGFFLEEAVEILEKTLIARTLEATSGNQSAAAKQLGIHRNTLQRKMIQFQLGHARRKPVAVERPARGRRNKAG